MSACPSSKSSLTSSPPGTNPPSTAHAGDAHSPCPRSGETAGATLDEIETAIREGEAAPAKHGRQAFRKNFVFQGVWKGVFYESKQVMPVAVKEGDDYVVITVYVFYFGASE
jgi:hypothetical protein